MLNIGWNLLNTHKVPFVKMWSKHLVPIPKDWGPHVDVVGFFVDTRNMNEVKKKADVITGPHKTSQSEKPLSIANSTPITNRTTTSTGQVNKIDSSHATAPPLISADTSDYEPPKALRDFLEAGPPPVFVGFGSMVVEDAASLIQVRQGV